MDPEADLTRSLTWREAEQLAAAHMRALGFADAEATPLGADMGLDVIASGGVAQVKHFSTSPVGSPDVQRLKGAGHGHSRLLFYSLNGYSSAALRYAEAAGVALFNYSTDGLVNPANGVATKLAELGYVPKDFGRSTAARERLIAELHEYGQTTIDCCTRLLSAVTTLMSDSNWTAQLTEDQFVNEVSPAVETLVRLQHLFRDLNGKHSVGHIMTTIAEAEGLGQQVAVVFGLTYEDFLTGAPVNE